jgi:hypothetical protein
MIAQAPGAGNEMGFLDGSRLTVPAVAVRLDALQVESAFLPDEAVALAPLHLQEIGPHQVTECSTPYDRTDVNLIIASWWTRPKE